MKYHKQLYKPLNREIRQSERRVHTAKVGNVRPRPLSAPDLLPNEQKREKMAHYRISPGTLSRPTSVAELTRRFLQRPPTNSTCTKGGKLYSQFIQDVLVPTLLCVYQLFGFCSCVTSTGLNTIFIMDMSNIDFIAHY